MTDQIQLELQPPEDGNPLLIPIPDEMDVVGLASWLRSDCVPGPWKWEAVLDELRRIFVDVEVALAIARSFMAVLRQGLKHRDPRLRENKKLVADMGRFKAKGLSFDKLPVRNSQAAAIVLAGVTGVGKSRVIERLCELLPRLYIHHENEEAGWLRHHQLVYLIVHMSADGTPGGFIDQAFLDLDAAAETSYCEQYLGKDISVARKLVAFMHALIVHTCGAIIIEECQLESMESGPFARLFQNYFLTMLNYGIPIVVIGNPAGVQWIRGKAQNLRRAAAGGVFRLDPVESWKTVEWTQDWVPSIWGVTCLPAEDDVWMERGEFEKLLWQLTGGFPDFLCKLRAETLRAAITSGSPRVEREHFVVACRSPRFVPLLEIAIPFSSRNPDAFAQPDLDVNYYRVLWSNPSTVKLEDLEASAPTNGEPPLIVPSSVNSSGGEVALPQADADGIQGASEPRQIDQAAKLVKKPRAAKAKTSGENFDDQDCRSTGWLARHVALMSPQASGASTGAR